MPPRSTHVGSTMPLGGFLVLSACALGACGADAPESVAEDDGADGASRWALAEALRIGSVDGAGTSFSRVTGIGRIGNTLLVLQRDPARVARFAPDGRWLGDFARGGDGPGELRIPQSIGVTAGRIWISDRMGRRLEVYGPAGRHIESFRFQVTFGPLDLAIPGALLSDGSIMTVPAPASFTPLIRGDVAHRTYGRATRKGEDLGALYVSDVYETDFFAGTTREGARIVGAHPLLEEALVAPFPDGSGVVVIERRWAGEGTPAYRVLVHAPDGRIETEALVPFEPIPADGFLEPYLAEREVEVRASPNIPAEPVASVLEAFRAVSPRAHYPPATDLVTGLDGTIWIRREDTFADSVAWQVLDRTARIIGTLTTSSDLTLHMVSRSEAWGVETDELDVQR